MTEITDEMVECGWAVAKGLMASDKSSMRKILDAVLNPPKIDVTESMLDAGNSAWNDISLGGRDPERRSITDKVMLAIYRAMRALEPKAVCPTCAARNMSGINIVSGGTGAETSTLFTRVLPPSIMATMGTRIGRANRRERSLSVVRIPYTSEYGYDRLSSYSKNTRNLCRKGRRSTDQ